MMSLEITIFIILMNLFLCIVGTILGLYSSIFGFMLIRYLQKNKVYRWKELMEGWLDLNPLEWIRFYIRIYKYTYNNLDTDDKNILKYKVKIRLPLTLAFSSIIIFSFLMTLLFILVYFGGIK